MGWYIVKKKIKGNVYLYRQLTYREGGKVRTCIRRPALPNHRPSLMWDRREV